MIKAKDGAVSVEGTVSELLADLATVVRAVKDTLMEEGKEESVKKQIDYAVKIGLMNDGEVKKEAEKFALEFVNKLFGGLFDEDK